MIHTLDDKRKQLEEKLEQRKIDTELKEEKSRSEKLLNLHEQELNLFTKGSFLQLRKSEDPGEEREAVADVRDADQPETAVA